MISRLRGQQPPKQNTLGIQSNTTSGRGFLLRYVSKISSALFRTQPSPNNSSERWKNHRGRLDSHGSQGSGLPLHSLGNTGAAEPGIKITQEVDIDILNGKGESLDQRGHHI